MTAAPPPVPEPAAADDSPLEKFLERAAPILTVERGLNARSRVRLLAVARDVGLPEGEFEQAVRLLQRAPARAESAEDKLTEPFRTYLHAKLESSTVKVFTPSLENRVVAVAIDKFELSDAQARVAIGQVTAERGVKRFSQQDCEDYVCDLVKERLGDDEWLDDESVNRLRAAGAQWGLSIAQVDAQIVAQAAANRDRHGKARSTSKLVLVAAVTAGVGVFLVLAVLLVWGNMGGPKVDDELTTGEITTEGPGEKPSGARPPKWWTVDLSLAQSRARTLLPAYRPVYERLCSKDAAVRGQGYEELVGLVKGGADAAESREALRRVVSASHALDPDESAAEKLRTALLAPASPDVKTLPTGPEAYDQAIWSVETALAAVYHQPANEQRSADMATALGKSLGISFDRDKPRPSVEKRCYAALAAALYRQLTAKAADSPGLARRLHARLAEWAQEHVEFTEIELLDVNVLAAMLPAAGSAWRDYEPTIAASIGSKEPLVVLKMLELYERSSDPALQDFLAELLLLRVRAKPKSNSRADVSVAVREALGAVIPAAPATARDRWESLRGLAQEPLARSAPSANEHAKMLEETLLLAYLGTLGCAVAQQEPGFALFDQLAKDGPPSLAAKKKEGEDDEPEAGPPRVGGALPPTAAQQRDLARFLEGLAQYKELTPLQRLTFVRGLAAISDRFAEIEPEQAAGLARFLLGEKPDEEQQRITESAEALCRWRSVRLALADLLADPAANVKIPNSLAAQLFGKALRREVNLGEPDWPNQMREQLVRGVMAELSAGDASPTTSEAAFGIDRGAAALLELYITRAKLLGLSPAQYRATATPAQGLEVLIAHQAAQLGSTATRPADAEYLARLPHELAVLEYLGTNDLRRTVLAQRVWLRLLSISLSRKRPEQASAAQAIVDNLTALDLKATQLLLQLRDGEAALVRLWLLHAPGEP